MEDVYEEVGFEGSGFEEDGFKEDLMSGANVERDKKSPKKTSKRIKRAHFHTDAEKHVREQILKTTKKSSEYDVNLYNYKMREVASELEFEHQELKHVPLLHLPYHLSKFFMVASKADETLFNASRTKELRRRSCRKFNSYKLRLVREWMKRKKM